MHGRVVGFDRDPDARNGQAADRRQQREAGDILVAFRDDEGDAGIKRFLLGVEHVERGTRADGGFLAHPLPCEP